MEKQIYDPHILALCKPSGKYNFTNMSRYGDMNEVSYRQNFAKRFDFLSFNSELIKTYCPKHGDISTKLKLLYNYGRIAA